MSQKTISSVMSSDIAKGAGKNGGGEGDPSSRTSNTSNDTFKVPSLAQAGGSPSPPSTPPLSSKAKNDNAATSPLPPPRRRMSVGFDNLLFLVPKTPDHQNLNNGFENTPLQSPTKTPRSVKRRSADVYNLLKTPEDRFTPRKLHEDYETDDHLDDELSRLAKRSSLELYKLLNNEENKVKLVQMSPTSASASVFNESNNPTSPSKNHYRVKKSDAEIKELSNNLKTRLNYLFLKVQHGWTEKPISELEKVVEQPSSGVRLVPISRPRPLSLHSSGTGSANFPNRIRLDDFTSSAVKSPKGRRRNSHSSTTNANEAVLSALSPKQPSRSQRENDPEKTAAMSLMKLSSPIKPNATMSFNGQPPAFGTPAAPMPPTFGPPPQLPPLFNSGAKQGRYDDEDNKTETDIDEDDMEMSNNDKTDEE